MTRIKRPAAAVGAAALLAFSLTACGGSPDDASKEDFCEAYSSQSDDSFNTEDPDKAAEALNDYADKLDEVGTPDDISDDARHGFEVIVDAFGDVDGDDLKDEDAQKALEDKYKDDEDDVNAFFEYATKKCIGDIPTDIPSDIPTDLTELPSDLTDIPTDLSDLTEIPTS